MAPRQRALVFDHMYERIMIIALVAIGVLMLVVALLGGAVVLTGSTDSEHIGKLIGGSAVLGLAFLGAGVWWLRRFTATDDGASRTSRR